MSLSTVEANLPPGFRFHPKDEELVCNYLMEWIAGPYGDHSPLLIQVDLNKCEPWDVPEEACVGGKEWYFYSQRDRKYATGLRTNRATLSGYWKATGKDRPVVRKGNLVGMRKTLVFYQGRAPKGKKTEWVMHEFRLDAGPEPSPKTLPPIKEDWVLCRMFYKSRPETLTREENENATAQITDPSSSFSLPPLAEPFGRMKAPYNQQVPCFSSTLTATHQDSASLDQLPSPSSCDKKMMKAVLNHLSRNVGSPSIWEESSGSYLSDIWN